ncbi:hypothetical protein [Streptomyces sp. 5-10]|uniref:hypothetical protein n=1 Tax=Streptomyces sp. 5-10 TaxID=878925 RepID=UPI00168B8CC9|nr:hypothetical protein [Streptomyces sp. 5-10]MBD3004771.1 hypothetical protein [Streptomyces sp. 5-10]
MKNAVKAAVPVVVLGLALTACNNKDSTPEHDVKGKVEAKQIDVDCHAKRHSMSLSSFSLPLKPPGRGSSGSGGTKSGKSDGGVKTGKKPQAPKKVDKLPSVPDGPDYKPGKKPGKSCKPEYELFIKNSEGIFEEDVEADHYDQCDKGEKFPECVK